MCRWIAVLRPTRCLSATASPGHFESGRTPKPDDPFTPATEGTDALQIVGRAKRGVTGTRVRYWADPQIFTPDAKFSYEDLAARARQTAFLIPGLRICIRDERRLPGTPGELEPHLSLIHI